MNTIKRGLWNTKDNKLRVIKLIKYKYKIKKNEYNNDVDYGIHVYKHRLKIKQFYYYIFVVSSISCMAFLV